MRILSKLLFFILLSSVLAASCGKSKRRNKDDDDTAVRTGTELESDGLKNYDAKPDLSADGQKISFISGRDDELRAYLFDRSGAAEAVRLTDDDTDLTAEKDVAITPDGAWVIFVATSKTGTNLYARDFAKTREVVQLTDDVAVESEVAIASDSSLFAFSVREPFSSGVQIYVGKIDATTGPDASSLKAVNADDTDETTPVWVPGGYTLLSLQRDIGKSTDYLVKRTVTVGGTLNFSDATKTASLTDLDFNRSIPYTATDSTVFFVADNYDDAVEPIKPQGSAVFNDEITVQDRVASLPLAGGTRSFLDGLGISETSISVTSSGIGAWVSRTPAACKDNNADYRNAINLYTPLDATTVTALLVTIKKDGTNEPSQSLCLSTEESEAKTKLDGSMVMAKINANGTDTDFVIAYVSIATGNNEVLLFVRVAGEDSIIKVSNNPT